MYAGTFGLYRFDVPDGVLICSVDKHITSIMRYVLKKNESKMFAHYKINLSYNV